MDIIHVQGSGPLRGEIQIQGSKNAVLPILAAAVLIEGTCCLKNCPHISDVNCMCRLLESMGCSTYWDEDGLKVDTSTLKESRLPKELVTSMRSSIILLGPLLARCKEASLDYPGGCVIGDRPIDMHLHLLKEMGAVFTIQNEHIAGLAEQLTGTTIRLPFPSVGTTENGILASVMAKGRTTLLNCALEPEVQQLCRFLNAAGAKIEGVGTDCLRIEGVEKLYPVTYMIEADRIVAGTYIFSAVATMGRIGILNTPVKELDSVLEVVKQMGCRLSLEGKHLEVWQKERPKAVSLVQTQVYPGFPTDLQSVLMTTLSVSDGESQIEENIFSNRFKIAGELVRMGAEIRIEGRRARIKGKEKLYAMSLLAEDLRGGAALVLAGICAQGNSLIGNCHYIERGYEDICRDYRFLGAAVEKIVRS